MSSYKSSSSGSGGLGFFSVLALIFIVLKLVGVIDWSWIWVLSPLWIGLAFWGVIIICIFVWVLFDSK